jgi:FXSXX-COOH protein
MEALGPDVEGHLVDLDAIPLAQVLGLDEDDSVLANSIRRVIDAAQRQPQDTVAAFNNYI